MIIIPEPRRLSDGRQSGTLLQVCRRDDVYVRVPLEFFLCRRHVRRGHLEVRHARPETRREGRFGGSLRR